MLILEKLKNKHDEKESTSGGTLQRNFRMSEMQPISEAKEQG
jgi:hypothetical protein